MGGGHAWQMSYPVSRSSFASACPRTQGHPWNIPLLYFLILKLRGLDFIPFIHTKPWNVRSIARRSPLPHPGNPSEINSISLEKFKGRKVSICEAL